MAKAKPKSRYNFGYGAIYQRKTKKGKIRWYVDYYDQSGTRIQRVIQHASSMEEAAIALQRDVEKTFDEIHGIRRKKDRIGFREFAELYLHDYAAIQKPRSWKTTDAGYVKAMNEFFGNLDLREITPMLIQQFRAARLKEGNEKSTTNRYLACLKKMLNVAIEEGYIETNPVSKVKFYSERENLRTRTLSRTEEAELLNHSADHLKPIIITALHTGMRLGEILSLKWGQVNLQKKEIRVEKTKSEKIRYIPINSDLHQIFLRLKFSNNISSFCFPNPKTARPFTTIKTAFNAAKRRSGIQYFRFHDLRHTAASRMVEMGVDLNTVKELLGHSSVKVTERYTHSHKEQKERAVELLVAKPRKNAQKRDDLLHICDMEKDGSIIPFPNVSESIN